MKDKINAYEPKPSVINELLDDEFYTPNVVFRLLIELFELENKDLVELLNNRLSEKFIKTAKMNGNAKNYRHLKPEFLHLFCVNLKNKLKKGDKK